LTPANQDAALDSMILRNALTDDIETAVALKNITFDPDYVFANGDYMENNPATFLTKSGALAALNFINNA
jgi:hypothetical protein